MKKKTQKRGRNLVRQTSSFQIETLFFQAEICFQIDMEFSDKKCSFATVWQGL